MIVVDTCVWSLAFRRQKKIEILSPEVQALIQLIEQDAPICMLGIVLQELLSGLKEETQLMKMQKLVSGFPIILATKKHHVDAAKLSNACRKIGIATSATDCLIAAITIDLNAQLLTTDQDFTYMQKCCNLDLFKL